MTTRRWILVAALVAALAGAGGVYVFVLSGSSVEPLELGTGGSPDPDDPSPRDDSLAGTWSATSGSEAGYRVREKFAQLPAKSDAVGRTSQVTGSIAITQEDDALLVSDMTFEVDMQSLKSDRDRRDNALKDRGIQTDEFPTATFTSTEAVRVEPAQIEAGTLETTVRGELTLHGVTQPIELPVKARLDGSVIEVNGSILLQMADYQIEPPSVAGIVTVDPEGTLEFLIRLERTSAASSPTQ